MLPKSCDDPRLTEELRANCRRCCGFKTRDSCLFKGVAQTWNHGADMQSCNWMSFTPAKEKVREVYYRLGEPVRQGVRQGWPKGRRSGTLTLALAPGATHHSPAALRTRAGINFPFMLASKVSTKMCSQTRTYTVLSPSWAYPTAYFTLMGGAWLRGGRARAAALEGQGCKGQAGSSAAQSPGRPHTCSPSDSSYTHTHTPPYMQPWTTPTIWCAPARPAWRPTSPASCARPRAPAPLSSETRTTCTSA